MLLHARATKLAQAIVLRDQKARAQAEQSLLDLGVVNAARMLGLRLPGLA